MKHRVFLLLGIVLAAVLLAGCSDANPAASKAENVAKAPPEVSSKIPTNQPVARVAAQVSPSVVQVNVKAIQTTPFGPQNEEGIGSGVIYRKDGYIITNNHVVEGASEVNVAFADGSTARGDVVGTDPYTDIAVVKVSRDNLPAAMFSDAQHLLVGQLAVAIGSPSGFQSTVTAGVISGLDRELPGQLTGSPQIPSLVDLIQTDAAISPGSSGGALANQSGEVVGINVAYLPPGQTGAENIGFAIPAPIATSVADQIIANGRAVHPYLGIRETDLTTEIADRFNVPVKSGVVIVQVQPGGPADQGGLEKRDVITAIGPTKVEDSGDLITALRKYKPGDTVKVTVIRNGEERTFEVQLGESPQQG